MIPRLDAYLVQDTVVDVKVNEKVQEGGSFSLLTYWFEPGLI